MIGLLKIAWLIRPDFGEEGPLTFKKNCIFNVDRSCPSTFQKAIAAFQIAGPDCMQICKRFVNVPDHDGGRRK
jgi:hypothetical protein